MYVRVYVRCCRFSQSDSSNSEMPFTAPEAEPQPESPKKKPVAAPTVNSDELLVSIYPIIATLHVLSVSVCCPITEPCVCIAPKMFSFWAPKH